jgi:hypothetical protein
MSKWPTYNIDSKGISGAMQLYLGQWVWCCGSPEYPHISESLDATRAWDSIRARNKAIYFPDSPQ